MEMEDKCNNNDDRDDESRQISVQQEQHNDIILNELIEIDSKIRNNIQNLNRNQFIYSTFLKNVVRSIKTQTEHAQFKSNFFVY